MYIYYPHGKQSHFHQSYQYLLNLEKNQINATMRFIPHSIKWYLSCELIHTNHMTVVGERNGLPLLLLFNIGIKYNKNIRIKFYCAYN